MINRNNTIMRNNGFIKYILVLTLTLVSTALTAQNNGIAKDKWHWGNTIRQDTTAGYVQVIKVDNILYISGAVATDVTPEGITSVYRALEQSLKSFGATFQNVVKENLYTTDIDAMKKFNHARKVFYKNDFPAATWVQVSRLYMPEARLEVELVAHLPKK
ncbi:RidA family protein [Parachryseolinea silvisoli]|jgi:2-iminobutanoate/2-iminopropanoate deaminase|uniref:RidA family protein n=1 Tax=Parachryseolinea silvisoli TaxID=2873601 RepID=UPI002265DE42|nr:RidA family protein [Parachryseolinea silvisoli]MCD9018035.1 RidA family protein [Parachryseolinea silvisoli]